MDRYWVFHEGKLLTAVELLPTIDINYYPVGAYIYSYRDKWYIIKDSGDHRIDKLIPADQVPAQYRALMLIL